MAVRLARPEDLPEIQRLSAFLGYVALAQPIAEAQFLDILASELDQLWVFQSQPQTLAGWIHGQVCRRLASPNTLEIVGLVVEPESRRLGIGQALVKPIQDWAKQTSMALRVRCHIERQQAHEFYQALSFQPQKTQKVFKAFFPN